MSIPDTTVSMATNWAPSRNFLSAKGEMCENELNAGVRRHERPWAYPVWTLRFYGGDTAHAQRLPLCQDTESAENSTVSCTVCMFGTWRCNTTVTIATRSWGPASALHIRRVCTRAKNNSLVCPASKKTSSSKCATASPLRNRRPRQCTGPVEFIVFWICEPAATAMDHSCRIHDVIAPGTSARRTASRRKARDRHRRRNSQYARTRQKAPTPRRRLQRHHDSDTFTVEAQVEKK